MIFFSAHQHLFYVSFRSSAFPKQPPVAPWPERLTVSKLHLIDLAGSERQKATGARSTGILPLSRGENITSMVPHESKWGFPKIWVCVCVSKPIIINVSGVNGPT